MSENYKNKNQVNYKFDFNLSKNEKKGSLGCVSLKTTTSEKQQKKNTCENMHYINTTTYYKNTLKSKYLAFVACLMFNNHNKNINYYAQV